MWKQIGDFGRKLFTLSNRVQKVEESDVELRAKIMGMQLQMDRMSELLQRLGFEFQRNRENADAERRIQLLEIENRFLRYDRQLPPPDREDTE